MPWKLSEIPPLELIIGTKEPSVEWARMCEFWILDYLTHPSSLPSFQILLKLSLNFYIEGGRMTGHVSSWNWKKKKNEIKMVVGLIKRLFLLIYVLLIMRNKWPPYCRTTFHRHSSIFSNTLGSIGFSTFIISSFAQRMPASELYVEQVTRLSIYPMQTRKCWLNCSLQRALALLYSLISLSRSMTAYRNKPPNFDVLVLFMNSYVLCMVVFSSIA